MRNIYAKLLLPMLFTPAIPTALLWADENNEKIVQIHLHNEEEFQPLQNYIDDRNDLIYGVVADTDSNFNDNGDLYNSYYSENNGIFEFFLPDEFDEINLDTVLKVSSVYDQYYSVTEVIFPVGADVLVKSQEIFNLRGNIKKGEEIEIGIGNVKTIIDRWGIDNSGYYDIKWTASLNKYGNELTLQAHGEDTGNIWAAASPIWAISEITTASSDDKEYHNIEGSGSTWFDHYPFQTPEDYFGNFMDIEGIIYY